MVVVKVLSKKEQEIIEHALNVLANMDSEFVKKSEQKIANNLRTYFVDEALTIEIKRV